ncbi:MAG: NAD(+)/NADH kinase [Clostridia bacterium]|nr:NAD(+)/NADH kinase [Clostridia bacterium]
MKFVFFTNPMKPNTDAIIGRLAGIANAHGIETVSTTDSAELEKLLSENRNDALCVVVIGGDGTVLRAVSAASPRDIPVLGVNLGRVGFFSEISVDEFERAVALLQSGQFHIERSAMLNCTVNGENMGNCLNDFAIHRQELASITHIELVIDGDSVGDVMADGLIVATPSGSTAYTMSAGGPVVAPKLECILVTPVCPHSLTVRPIVAAVDSEITVKLKCVCRLSLDGQNVKILYPDDEVGFRNSKRTAAFIRFGNRNVFKLIREKLR